MEVSCRAVGPRLVHPVEGAAAGGRGSSEGQVVELGVVKATTATAATGSSRGSGRSGRREVAIAVLTGLALEGDHVVGRDLERRPVRAVLRVVFARPEATLDEDAIPLPELLGGALGAVAPDRDPEPVGALVRPLAGLRIAAAMGDRDAEL